MGYDWSQGASGAASGATAGSNFGPWGTLIGAGIGAFGGFGNDPYGDAMKKYHQLAQQGRDAQNPFYEAGKGAIGDYQSWLNGQKNPTQFVNNLMGDYKESPYAHYMQQQSVRAGQNAGSASGLMGSTALAQQLQQSASDISGQDMNQWLQNVLGINTQYGQGEKNLMDSGQHAADQITNSYNQESGDIGNATYGRTQQGKIDQQNMMANFAKMSDTDRKHIMASLSKMFPSLFGG